MWLWPAWVIRHSRCLDSGPGTNLQIIMPACKLTHPFCKLSFEFSCGLTYTDETYSVSRSEPYARTLVLFVYAEKEKMLENWYPTVIYCKNAGYTLNSLKWILTWKYFAFLYWCCMCIPFFWNLFQENIILVDEIVPNQISSSRLRYWTYTRRHVD
jgi:hypothetical protein